MAKLLNKTFMVAAAVATIAVSGALVSNEVQAAIIGMEKCYGVTKAGKNDCGANGHSCAGNAKVDGDPNEWLYLPKGFCNRLNGGTTENPDA